MQKNKTQKKTNVAFGLFCLVIAIALLVPLFTEEQKPSVSYSLISALLLVVALLFLFVPPASVSEARQRELKELIEIFRRDPEFVALTDLYATFDTPEDVSRAIQMLTALSQVEETPPKNESV